MEPTTDAILIFVEGNRFSVLARTSEPRCVLSYGNRYTEKNKNNNIVEYYYNNDNNNDDDEDNKNSNKTAENISITYSL